MSEIKEKAAKLEKFKYPLIILIVGVVLMLIPGRAHISTRRQALTSR